MVVLCGRAGCLTTQNGGFWPGQLAYPTVSDNSGEELTVVAKVGPAGAAAYLVVASSDTFGTTCKASAISCCILSGAYGLCGLYGTQQQPGRLQTGLRLIE